MQETLDVSAQAKATAASDRVFDASSLLGKRAADAPPELTPLTAPMIRGAAPSLPAAAALRVTDVGTARCMESGRMSLQQVVD